ncbi:MAG: HlyD family secretion protein [Alphaproteobacteria bacterium]
MSIFVKNPILRPGALALAALLLLGACEEAPRRYLGYVEGEFLRIGPDEPGRLAELAVRRGETVEAGQRLFALETETYEADREAAASRLQEAEATLANLMAQQRRPEEVEVLLARKERAEADLELAREELGRQRKLFEDGFVSQARLDQAQAEFQRAKASLSEVEKEIKTARLSARLQQIEQARAAVEAARAALAAAKERLARRIVNAPEGGLIQDVFFWPGELVPAGRPVVSLLPPERRKIVFYVPEPSRARFEPGMRVEVECDACREGLTARVDWISAQEEFTPPVIFSPQERAKLVYRLEARPDRPLALAPGQPVTVAPLAAAQGG